MRATKHTGWFICYNCGAERDTGYEVDKQFTHQLKSYGQNVKSKVIVATYTARVILCKECYEYCKSLRRREK